MVGNSLVIGNRQLLYYRPVLNAAAVDGITKEEDGRSPRYLPLVMRNEKLTVLKDTDRYLVFERGKQMSDGELHRILAAFLGEFPL